MIPSDLLHLAFFDVGGSELILILVVALLLFGGKLPEVARTVGRTVGELKRNAEDLTRDFRDEMDIGRQIRRPYKPVKPRKPKMSLTTRDDEDRREPTGEEVVGADDDDVTRSEGAGVEEPTDAPDEPKNG